MAIRKQLRLRGNPQASFQIRNIPQGSDNYYLCYPELCLAYAYVVQKNQAGEIVNITNRSEIRLKEEVEEAMNQEDDAEAYGGFLDKIYPTADPGYLELYVYADEKLGFQASESYVVKVIATITAFNEIENESAQIFVTVGQITDWLARHHDLYWSLQFDYNLLAFKSFQTLYDRLQFIADHFKNITKAQQAVQEYLPFDEAWLEKYDRLYFAALMTMEGHYEVFHEDPFILKQVYGNLHLVGEEFKALYQFPDLFKIEYYRGVN